MPGDGPTGSSMCCMPGAPSSASAAGTASKPSRSPLSQAAQARTAKTRSTGIFITHLLSQPEDVEHAARARVVLDALHGAYHAQRRVRIVVGDVGKRRRAHPAADPGIDGDVLLAIRTEVRDRVADDPGAGLELPQFPPGARVHCLEPAFERAVEDHVAAGDEHAAVERPARIADPPDL